MAITHHRVIIPNDVVTPERDSGDRVSSTTREIHYVWMNKCDKSIKRCLGVLMTTATLLVFAYIAMLKIMLMSRARASLLSAVGEIFCS